MNRGAARLAELFEGRAPGPRGGVQQQIADAIGVSQSIVSRWLSGDRRPDPVQRARMEDLYGIGWRLWDQDVEAESGPGSSDAPQNKGSAA